MDFVGALNFLEGQLNRKVSNDPLEQARYWIDLAEGLRGLNLHESLPALLRRADDALDMPLAEGYAAEVVSFAAFAEYLHDPLTPEGQSALRVLRVAMEGVRVRQACPAAVYADAAFGDAVRRLSENCPDAVNPRLVLAFIEALRHARRSFHTHAAFRDDPVRRQTVRWQHAFLRDAEPVMREYLHDIGRELTGLLENDSGPRPAGDSPGPGRIAGGHRRRGADLARRPDRSRTGRRRCAACAGRGRRSRPRPCAGSPGTP